MLLPASMITLCGAFLRPRVSPWLTTESRHFGIRFEACKARHQRRSAERAAGDMWENTPHYGGGGMVARAAAFEEDAGAMGLRTERNISSPLDVLHRNEDFA